MNLTRRSFLGVAASLSAACAVPWKKGEKALPINADAPKDPDDLAYRCARRCARKMTADELAMMEAWADPRNWKGSLAVGSDIVINVGGRP